MVSTVRNLVKSAAIALTALIVFGAPQTAEAVLEGSNRERMEYLDYSEALIRDGLYAKRGDATFSKEKKEYVNGIKRHNEPRIYEPDVYTWRLAMEEHKKRLLDLAPPEMPDITIQREEMKRFNISRDGKKKYSEAAIMTSPSFGYPPTLPDNPVPVFNPTQQYIQPVPSGNIYVQQGYTVQPFVEQTMIPAGQTMYIQSTPALPGDAQETMNNMLYRARVRGIYPSDPLRGYEIRQSLGNSGFSY